MVLAGTSATMLLNDVWVHSSSAFTAEPFCFLMSCCSDTPWLPHLEWQNRAMQGWGVQGRLAARLSCQQV